jgi:nucleotide-binding universal stress UspA family protein
MAKMSPFNKILLCYDSSREGRRALLQGAELAEKLGAQTHLLAIANEAGGPVVGQPSEVAMRREESRLREILCEGVGRLRARGLIAKGHLVFGRPIDEIPRIARNLGIDLIVVGHRPCGMLERWWSGPGNRPLLDLVTCSILVSIDLTAADGSPR